MHNNDDIKTLHFPNRQITSLRLLNENFSGNYFGQILTMTVRMIAPTILSVSRDFFRRYLYLAKVALHQRLLNN